MRTDKTLCAAIAVLALSAGCSTNDESMSAAPQSPSVVVVRPIASQPASQASNAVPSAVQLDDETVTVKVKTALLEAPDARGLAFNIETVNGIVTLKGMVSSFSQAVRVIRIARATEGVRHIDNRLMLKSL